MRDLYHRCLKPYLEDDAVIMCVIFLFAFFVRLSFLPHLIHDPAFLYPVVDAKEHNYLAFQILNISHWGLPSFWYHTPGYAYFVAFVYKILGHSVVRLAVVQFLLAALSAVLTYGLTRKLINRFAAIAAALVCAIYWFFVYTQAHVYSENLSMICNLLMLTVLLRARDVWWKYLVAGVLLGLSVLVRPEVLPFAGLLLFWLIGRKLPWSTIVRHYLFFAAGALGVILQLLITNYQLSGHFLIREQIGINFFLGSLPEYKGSNIYVTIGRKCADVTALPYQEPENHGRELSEPELNAYYTGRVFDYIKEKPVTWLGFISAKFLSVLTGIDFMRSEDAYFYDRYIRGTPFSFLQTWHIFILALLGIILSARKEAGRFFLLYIFLASYLFSVFFTFKTRYVISYLPVIIIFSVYALNEMRGLLVGKNWHALAGRVLILLVLGWWICWNPLKIVWPNQSEMYYVIGQNYDFAGDYETAKAYYERAIEMDPGNVTAINELALAHMKTGNYGLAREVFDAGRRQFPGEPYFEINSGILETYSAEGRAFSDRDMYGDAFLAMIRRYYSYFTNPYNGPVYAATNP